MGIFERFRRLVQSNLNDMISKAEDPEKMLNQLITDMNQQLIESKKSVASAIADEKKIERQMNQSREQAQEWERKAMLAVRAGKDDLAKEALARKREMEKYAGEYKEQLDQQHESVEKLKTALRGLQQKIEEAQRKKNLLVARSKRVEAQKRLQGTLSGMSDTSAFEAFDRMSQKMDQLEAENEAMEELEDFSGKQDIDEKFAELESGTGDADKMLEDLKKRMALEDKTSASSGRSEESGKSGNESSSSDASSSAGNEGDDDVDATLEELKRRMKDEE
ncbi:MAG: PspA/IM30 family protein [Spirochaetaceae bacterium]